MKYNKSVYKSLALISQLGISVMVPIALCVAAGLFIDHYFHTSTVIPLLILGILAGGRNMYVIAMAFVRQDEKDRLNKHQQKRQQQDRHKKGS